MMFPPFPEVDQMVGMLPPGFQYSVVPTPFPLVCTGAGSNFSTRHGAGIVHSRQLLSLIGGFAAVTPEVSPFPGQVLALTGEAAPFPGQVLLLIGVVLSFPGQVIPLTGEFPAVSGQVPTLTGEVSAFPGQIMLFTGLFAALT
jgi:hypothetical protein